jgi:hypothetical protein
MRSFLLVAIFAVGAILAGCSKPEPAAGAPSPDAVVIDSTKAADSTVTGAAADSAATVTDSATAVTDSAASTADSAASPDELTSFRGGARLCV